MTLTLLLDLDDTLLQNPLDKFFPAYMSALSSHLAPYVDPKKMVPQLIHATNQMIEKDDPCDTLETVFDDDFYFPLGLQKEQLAAPIHDFYEHDFNNLKKVTSPMPGAKQLMDYAFRQGWGVVIATNPVFPRIAVLKRLEWAGLPADEYPYKLITSFEYMHFTKPHPAFYAEILGQLGWQEDPVCMVGNSLADDLLPAGELGIPGFWVDGDDPSALNKLPLLSAAGSLDEIFPWLDQIADQPSPAEITDLDGILAVLNSTPAALEALTNTCSKEDWRLRPIHGEWSLLEIICHLRDVEREVNLSRFQMLTNTLNPFIPGVDSDRWAIERKYNEQDDSAVYTDFCTNRAKVLEIVRRYSAEDWKQSVRHSIFGPTTRLELVKFIATHDKTHLLQIAQTIQAMH
jgi:FMN phosphatase YigB (HAD superfamily)